MLKDYYEKLSWTSIEKIKNAHGVEEEIRTIRFINGVINQAGSKEIEFAKARNIDVDYKAYTEILPVKKDDLIEGMRVISEPKNTLGRNNHLKILLKVIK